MSLPVVRCPACGGRSRVPPEALGQMVGCPRCQSPFVAAADDDDAPVPTRAGKPVARPTARPARRDPGRGEVRPRPAAAIPIAPPRVDPADGPPPTEAPDPEHDPHTPIPGGLPFSVLVGFALMPFAIPLLWLVGPPVTGFEPALSPAVPVSLAVAAAALCLGVVYTIDWTAITRIKGVLMLVCLAYLSAAGLYFLKKDLMDRVQGFFATPPVWEPATAPDSNCRVKMPGAPEQVPVRPFELRGVEWADGLRAKAETWPNGQARTCSFVVVVSRPKPPAKGDDAWFDEAGVRLKDAAKANAITRADVPDETRSYRQWVLTLPDGDAVRVARVFVIHGRVYYLAAEGPNLTAADEDVVRFFESFTPGVK